MKRVFTVLLFSLLLLTLVQAAFAAETRERERMLTAPSAPEQSVRSPNVLGDPTPYFADVSATVGMTEPVQSQHMPGQAWADVNRDGYLDLYLTGGVNDSVLYLGQADNGFVVAPYADQVNLSDRATGGAVFGDYNNDGWPDLYVLVNSEASGLGNVLFENQAGEGFVDVSDAAGAGDLGVGTTGSWGDYDGDGHLDLYVANWFCNACPNGSRDTLYHNNGDGTFTDVSAYLGASTLGPGFVASWLDYDNDGDLDIYLVNDKAQSPPPPPHPGHNILWRNDGSGCLGWCFTDVSVAAGADIAVDGMGLAVGDYDLDGDLDLYFSNAGPQKFLQNQTAQGSPTFLEVSTAAGVDFDAVGWGTIFFDYNNDGWLDLYLATMDADPSRANRLFENQGDGTFADVTDLSGAANTGQTLGVAYADYNRDGWVDFVIGNLGEPYTLYENLASASSNDWRAVRLVGGGAVNRDAIGSRVELALDDGRHLMQEIKSGSALGSGNDLTLHFGLGQATPLTATVHWSDGLSETIESLVGNTLITWEYPRAGISLSAGLTGTALAYQTVIYTHTLVNEGNRGDTFALTLESASGWATLSETELALSAGESAVFTVTVSIPAAAHVVDLAEVTATSGRDGSVVAMLTDTTVVGTGIYLPTVSVSMP